MTITPKLRSNSAQAGKSGEGVVAMRDEASDFLEFFAYFLFQERKYEPVRLEDKMNESLN